MSEINSMLKVKVIGSGAAGNKAAIASVEYQSVNRSAIMLVNSTKKDIPKEYMELEESGQIFILPSVLGGCGKEPKMAQKLTLKCLQMEDGLADALENFIGDEEDTDLVIVTGAPEGGTGCGSVPIIASWIESELGVPTIVVALDGFGKDVRGLQNTISFYKNLNEDLAIQSICSKKFLAECGNDELAAVKMANEEFATRVSIMAGNNIYASEQNIDRTDHMKVVTRPGFTDILHIDIDEKIKNKSQFEQYLKDLVDSSKSIEYDSKQQIVGIIINIPEGQKQYIDYDFKEVINAYGTPFERFLHVQSNDAYATSISVIPAGMLLPQEELQAIYDKYIEDVERVQKASKKDVFDTLNDMDEMVDDEFDISTSRRRKRKGNNFFAQFDKDDNTEVKDSVKGNQSKY